MQRTLAQTAAVMVGFQLASLLWLFFGYQLEFVGKPVFLEVQTPEDLGSHACPPMHACIKGCRIDSDVEWVLEDRQSAVGEPSVCLWGVPTPSCKASQPPVRCRQRRRCMHAQFSLWSAQLMLSAVVFVGAQLFVAVFFSRKIISSDKERQAPSTLKEKRL